MPFVFDVQDAELVIDCLIFEPFKAPGSTCKESGRVSVVTKAQVPDSEYLLTPGGVSDVTKLNTEHRSYVRQTATLLLS